MPSDQPTPSTSGPAFVDKLLYSLKAALPVRGYRGWVAMRRRLWQLGVVPSLPQITPAASETLKIKCSLDGLPGGAVVDLYGKIRVTYGGSDDVPVILNSGSALGFNPQKALATTLPADTVPLCLDGNNNTVGDPSTLPPDLPELQYAIIAEVVDRFVALLGEAAGGDLAYDRDGEGLWLQYVEVSRDIAVPDAIGLVDSLRDSSLHGAGQADSERFNAKGKLRHVGAYRALSWREDRQKGPVRAKLYPKGRTLVRAEIVYPERDIILRELKIAGVHSPWAPFDGSQAAELVRPVVAIAQPNLDIIAAHAAAGLQVKGERVTFIAGLAPLLRIITPPSGKLGAKTRAETVDLAHMVVSSLLRTGMYSVKGLDSKSPVRLALYEMADDPNGIVNRGGSRRSVFTIKPAYEDARTAFREILYAGVARPDDAPRDESDDEFEPSFENDFIGEEYEELGPS